MTNSQKFILDNRKKLAQGSSFFNVDTSLMKKEDFDKAKVKILVIFGTPVSAKASSATAAALNDFIITHCPNAFIDFAYYPESSDLRLYDNANMPYAIGQITHLDPSHFDFVGFSISVLHEIMVVPLFMKSFERCDKPIPLFWSQRKNLKLGESPLILLGGITSFYSDSIFGKVGNNQAYADFIYLGAADKMDVYLNRYIQARETGKVIRNQEDHYVYGTPPNPVDNFISEVPVVSNQDFIDSLFDLPWIYQPQAYEVKYNEHNQIISNKKINPKAQDFVQPYYPHELPDDLGLARTIINANGDSTGYTQVQISEGAMLKGSLLRTSEGFKRVEDLCPLEKGHCDYNSPILFDTTLGAKSISHVYNQGSKKLRLFTLKSGIQIGLTPEHPVEQIDFCTKRTFFREAQNLKVGDVFIQKASAVWNNSCSVSCEEAEQFGEFLAKEPFSDYSQVFSYGKEQLKAFLRGFYKSCTSQASCEELSREFYSDSPYLIKDLQQFLLALGVVSRLDEAYDKYLLILNSQTLKNIDFLDDCTSIKVYTEIVQGLNGWFYDEIVSIEDIEGQVYDVTVPYGERIIANGCSIHNCSAAGACSFKVDANTRIWTSQGLIKIRDAFKSYSGKIAGKNDESFKEVVEQIPSRTFRVTTVDGHFLDCDENHRWLVNIDNRLVEHVTSQLKKGDKILRRIGSSFDVSSYCSVDEDTPNVLLNEDLATIFGYLHKNPPVFEGPKIVLYFSDSSLRQYQGLFKTYFPQISEPYKNTLSNREDTKWEVILPIDRTIDIELSKITKLFWSPYLIELLCRSPKSVMISYLRALFDGHDYYTDNIEQFSNNLILLLSWLGIDAQKKIIGSKFKVLIKPKYLNRFQSLDKSLFNEVNFQVLGDCVQDYLNSLNYVEDEIDEVKDLDCISRMFDVVSTESSFCVYNDILTHNCAEGNATGGWVEKSFDRVKYELREAKKYAASYKVRPYSFNCLYEDTIIPVGNGQFKLIKDVVNTDPLISWGGKESSCKEIQPVNHTTIVKPRLSRGDMPWMSLNHQQWVMTSDGLAIRYAGDLKVNDIIPIQSSYYRQFLEPVTRGTKYYFLGLWYGDGTRSGSYKDDKWKLTRQFVAQHELQLKSLCDNSPYFKYKANESRDGVYVYQYTKDFQAFVKSIFPNYKYEDHNLYSLSLPQLLEFIAGLFDADGSSSSKVIRIDLSVKSWSVQRLVGAVLNSIGCQYRHTTTSKVLNGKEFYFNSFRLVGRESNLIFRDYIGFIESKKQSNIRSYIKLSKCVDKMIPAVVGFYLYQELKRINPQYHSTAINSAFLHGDQGMLVSRFIEVFSSYRDQIELIDLICNGLSFAKIEDIEISNGFYPCFDIVESSNKSTFVADSVLTHNSNYYTDYKNLLYNMLQMYPKASFNNMRMEELGRDTDTLKMMKLMGSNHLACLDKDTLITTKRGLIPIKDVEVGDEVLSIDYDVTPNGIQNPYNVWTKVRAVKNQGIKPLYKVILANGNAVLATDDHLFLSSQDLECFNDVPTQNLVGPDFTSFILFFDEGCLKLVQVLKVMYVKDDECWDIQVEGKPYFVANNIVVHNCPLEGLSPRIQNNLLNKCLSESSIHNVMSYSVHGKLVDLKIGTIITKFETDEDFDWIFNFIKKYKDQAKQEDGLFVARINMTPLVCYPLTPCEYFPRLTAKNSLSGTYWFTDEQYSKFRELGVRVKVNGFKYSTFLEQSLVDLGRTITPLIYKHFVKDLVPIYNLRSVATEEFLNELISMIDQDKFFEVRDPDNYISVCHRIHLELQGSYIDRARRFVQAYKNGDVFAIEPDIRCLKTYEGAPTVCRHNMIKDNPLKIYNDVEMDENGNLHGDYQELTGCNRCFTGKERLARLKREIKQTKDSSDIEACPRRTPIQKLRFIIYRNSDYDTLNPNNTAHTFLTKYLQLSDNLLDSFYYVDNHSIKGQAEPKSKYYVQGYQVVDTVWTSDVLKEVRSLIPQVNEQLLSTKVVAVQDLLMDDKIKYDDLNVFYFESSLPLELFTTSSHHYEHNIKVWGEHDVMTVIQDKSLLPPIFKSVGGKVCGVLVTPAKHNPIEHLSGFLSARVTSATQVVDSTNFICDMFVRSTSNGVCKHCGKENSVISLITGKPLNLGIQCLMKAILSTRIKK